MKGRKFEKLDELARRPLFAHAEGKIKPTLFREVRTGGAR
jgi:hypothetical protein